MKTSLKLFFTVLIGSILVSCSTNKAEHATDAPEGMHTLNLSRYGKPFIIFVPDTTASRLQITEQSSGSLDIKVGRNFAVSINEQPADLELVKSDLRGDEVNKFIKFIVEEPSAIMWESAITDPEYHFLINKKIGTSDYSIEDARNGENTFSREAVQKMFDSCMNMRENDKS